MKTCLFALCWLDEVEKDFGRSDPGTRLERNIKYLRYYKPLLPLLGADSIHLYDNASSLENLKALVDASGMTLNKDLFITRFAHHMPRKGPLDYPYCWRFLRQSSIDLPEMGYEKIITIDTDLFVLNRKPLDYARDLRSGWTVMWDEACQFQEAAFQVICKDQFNNYSKIAMEPIYEKAGQTMEKVLPYTHVEKKFHGGRFSEIGLMPDATMDFYGQCHVLTEVKFNEKVD